MPQGVLNCVEYFISSAQLFNATLGHHLCFAMKRIRALKRLPDDISRLFDEKIQVDHKEDHHHHHGEEDDLHNSPLVRYSRC